MVARCPNCGNAALEDQSVFCNKCGARLPEEVPQEKVVINQEKVVISPVVRPAVIPAVPVRMPERPAGIGSKILDRMGPRMQQYFSFGTFYTPRYMPAIYAIGFAGITLVALLAIFSPQADGTSFVYWTVVLVVGNIAWRLACEAAVALFKVHDAMVSSGAIHEEPAAVTREYGSETGAWEEGSAAGRTITSVRCPHCGATVQSDQIRQCDHCGITGCERCIKQTGFIRKSNSCRECFETR
jgi:hypothetical protein